METKIIVIAGVIEVSLALIGFLLTYINYTATIYYLAVLAAIGVLSIGQNVVRWLTPTKKRRAKPRRAISEYNMEQL